MEDRLKARIFFLSILCLVPPALSFGETTFPGSELLGRPTDHSIMLNVVANTGIEAYVEYGTASGVYRNRTVTATANADESLKFLIDNLATDKRYYYRLRYRIKGSTGNFEVRPEYTFHTQRAWANTFVFTVISDSHLGWKMFNHPALYEIASQNVRMRSRSGNLRRSPPRLALFKIDPPVVCRQRRGHILSRPRPYLCEGGS